MRNKLEFISYLYVFLILLYFLQGTLYAESSLLSQCCVALFIAISVYYQVVVSFRYREPLLRITNLFVILLTVYGIWSVGSRGGMYALEHLRGVYIALSSVFPVYYFVKNGAWQENMMRTVVLLFIVVSTVSYFRTQQMMAAMLELDIVQGEYTNNSGYMFAGLIPTLLLFSKKRWAFWGILFYLSYYILLAAKRGAIVITIIMLVILLYYEIQQGHGVRRFLNQVTIFVIVAIGLYYTVNNMFAHSEYLQFRLESTLEGYSSGRDEIYSDLWRYWTSAQLPIGRFLFGAGFFECIFVTGYYAHSDWLQLAVDMGLLGIIVYLIYYLTFFRTVLKARKYDNRSLYVSLLLLFIMIGCRSLFSMVYFNMDNVLPSMYLGYLLAQTPTCCRSYSFYK